jgi:hypothetical protein
MKQIAIAFLFACITCGLSAQTVLQQFTAVSAGAGETTDMDLKQPTAEGSLIIAMPESLTPGIDVLSVTDNAPEGGNTYKSVDGATSSCSQRPLQIWYCENCKGGVTELKFHQSGHVRGSINSFLEVSDITASSALDGDGVRLNDGTANNEGREVGPAIKTSSTDFVIARYSSAPHPKSVTPAQWTYQTTYVYGVGLPAGTYQPTLVGDSAGAQFCMSIAAFRTASSIPAKP